MASEEKRRAAMDELASTASSKERPSSVDSDTNSHSQGSIARKKDISFPIATISRIMKKAVPTDVMIAEDAKDAVQECVSMFITFITSEANDKRRREARKSIRGDDLLCAMDTLGFEDYLKPLRLYLHKIHRKKGISKP